MYCIVYIQTLLSKANAIKIANTMRFYYRHRQVWPIFLSSHCDYQHKRTRGEMWMR